MTDKKRGFSKADKRMVAVTPVRKRKETPRPPKVLPLDKDAGDEAFGPPLKRGEPFS